MPALNSERAIIDALVANAPWPFHGEPDCGQHRAWFDALRAAAELRGELRCPRGCRPPLTVAGESPDGRAYACECGMVVTVPRLEASP